MPPCCAPDCNYVARIQPFNMPSGGYGVCVTAYPSAMPWDEIGELWNRARKWQPVNAVNERGYDSPRGCCSKCLVSLQILRKASFWSCSKISLFDDLNRQKQIIRIRSQKMFKVLEHDQPFNGNLIYSFDEFLKIPIIPFIHFHETLKNTEMVDSRL